MFPGGGAQYADMGKDLYETEEVFKNLNRDQIRRYLPDFRKLEQENRIAGLSK